eukprot:gene46898-58501_t
MLSTLLVEIDGLNLGGGGEGGDEKKSSELSDSSAVIVIATVTNMSCLDRSLIRPGRLE